MSTETALRSRPSADPPEPEALRLLSPTGLLGYGINAESLQRAIAAGIDVIGVDAGSTDMGAYYLGSGTPYQSRVTMKRDLGLILEAGLSNGLPVLVGSAGGAGAAPHLAWTEEVLLEVVRERDLHFTVAVITADQDGEFLKQRLRAGRVRPMPGAPELTEDAVDRCERLVAQMGAEPYIAARDRGADVVIAGRSCDSTIFAAEPIRRGYDAALAYHLGKILECGALSATPPTGRDCLLTVLHDEHFEVIAPNPDRRVTPSSLAAHMVYEVEHPYLHGEPAGVLDLGHVEFAATDHGSTVVRGARFHPHERPSLRFEGAELEGYRSCLVGGIRDPGLIERLDDFLEGCSEQTHDLIGSEIEFRLQWVVYGRDGVMGPLEPQATTAHEVGIVAQILASTQEQAHDVAMLLEARMIGFSYAGSATTTANIAFPMSPVVVDTGPVYTFTVLHVVELDDPGDLVDLFPITLREL